MKLLKWLFNNKKSVLELPVTKHNDFSIEFYPLTNRYYPKYKNYYMLTNCSTGIVEKKESYLFSFSEYGKTEAEANKIIEKFKEHQLKENVVTIKK